MKLFPYQELGAQFAISRPNCIIADEMGLGKTPQAIAVIKHVRKVALDAAINIVCPKSLILNWRNELDAWGVIFQDIRIINYEKLKEIPTNKKTYALTIFDEAHFLKNPTAQRTVQAQRVAAVSTRTLLLTGTPIANRPIELYSLLSLIQSTDWEYRGEKGQREFAKRYCDAKRVHVNWKYKCRLQKTGVCKWCKSDWKGSSNLEELGTKLSSWGMIRREKSDVLADLPEKTRQMLIFEPTKKWDSYELLIPDVCLESDLEKTISQLTANKVEFTEISKVRHEQGLAKVPLVVDHLTAMIESGIKKIVVFAVHRDVIEAIANALREDYAVVTMTGEHTPEERQQAVEFFQKTTRAQFFIGTIAAAGSGITLTASSNVVYAEQSWAPYDMLQSEDRVHRINQHHPVLIQNLVFNNTLDARIAKVLWKKNKNISTILEGMKP